MSRVVKYYYSAPVYQGTVSVNPIIEKTVIYDVKPCLRYTIAAVYDDNSHTIKFGLAVCQPVDNFNKAIGRKIAERNALENPFHVIENFGGRRNDYADEVMSIMIEKEKNLLKRHNPKLFNSNYFVE